MIFVASATAVCALPQLSWPPPTRLMMWDSGSVSLYFVLGAGTPKEGAVRNAVEHIQWNTTSQIRYEARSLFDAKQPDGAAMQHLTAIDMIMCNQFRRKNA